MYITTGWKRAWVAAALFVADAAWAVDEGGSASVCVPQDSTNASRISIESDGARNNSTSAEALIRCGFVRLSSSSPSEVFVDYHDGSTTDNLECLMIARGFNGTLLWSQSLTTTPNSFTGTSFFNFSIPTSHLGYMSLLCYLPAKSGSSMSYLRGFNVQ
jgi:hypothetical protein